MSRDLKVLTVEFPDLQVNPNTKWEHLDYINLTCEKMNDWYKLKNRCKHLFVPENSDCEVSTFDSCVYHKDSLIEFMNDNYCGLFNELRDCIKKAEYDYIALQEF